MILIENDIEHSKSQQMHLILTRAIVTFPHKIVEKNLIFMYFIRNRAKLCNFLSIQKNRSHKMRFSEFDS